MQMTARIRVVVDVPYEYDVQPPDENGNSAGSVEAADYANTTLLDNVKNAMASVGTVVDDSSLVEGISS